MYQNIFQIIYYFFVNLNNLMNNNKLCYFFIGVGQTHTDIVWEAETHRDVCLSPHFTGDCMWKMYNSFDV